MASSPPKRSSATATAAPRPASSVVSATWATTPPVPRSPSARRGAPPRRARPRVPERRRGRGGRRRTGRRPPPTIRRAARPQHGGRPDAPGRPGDHCDSTLSVPPVRGSCSWCDLRCRRAAPVARPATTAARSAAAARIRRPALLGRRPGRVAEHPVGADRPHARRPEQGQQLVAGRGVARAGRGPARTRPGAMASMQRGLGPSGVQVAPPARPPGGDRAPFGGQAAEGPGQRRGVAAVGAGQHHVARRSSAADRPSSTRSASVASWPMERVPAKPSCSPLEP